MARGQNRFVMESDTLQMREDCSVLNGFCCRPAEPRHRHRTQQHRSGGGEVRQLQVQGARWSQADHTGVEEGQQ